MFQIYSLILLFWFRSYIYLKFSLCYSINNVIVLFIVLNSLNLVYLRVVKKEYQGYGVLYSSSQYLSFNFMCLVSSKLGVTRYIKWKRLKWPGHLYLDSFQTHLFLWTFECEVPDVPNRRSRTWRYKTLIINKFMVSNPFSSKKKDNTLQ